MRYHALACDYDGTIAHHGRVDTATLDALERLRTSGRKLLLVSGRHVEDLQGVFPRLDIFDRAVLENGAVVLDPATNELRCIAEPPPACFVEALEERGVRPLAVGRVIVATWEPHERVVLEVIRELGLELQVVFNKGAVMVLPSGVNKAVGLRDALSDLGLSPHNVVGVGDAENDHAFFDVCEMSVAVSNAVPMLKEHAGFVTRHDHGRGVRELIDEMLHDDLRSRAACTRRSIVLGASPDQAPVCLRPYAAPMLVTGTSGAGKSRLALAMLEQLDELGYQFCVVDPEGDYPKLHGATVLGDAEHAPPIGEILEVLEAPVGSVVANFLAIPPEDRPACFASLLSRLFELRGRTGRPHWTVIDETHLVLPDSLDPARLALPREPHGLLLLTVHPARVSAAILQTVETVITLGASPRASLEEAARAMGVAAPAVEDAPLAAGHAIVWTPRQPEMAPVTVTLRTPHAAHRRHIRRYAKGELGEDASFFFRGPAGRLNLRAHNLGMFVRLAEGIDDVTWRFHLRRGDYSAWFRERIKDVALADEAATVERADGLSAGESRARIRAAIERRYSAPP
jgi:hydroxymethylpyrimidine pyrophosphatase-like HAD family hydrolase